MPPSPPPSSTGSCTARSCSPSTATPTASETTTPGPTRSALPPPAPASRYANHRRWVGKISEQLRPRSLSAITEERMHVGTEHVQTGQARLRKYVVTETVQQSVPVSHEEIRVDREPITEANIDQAMDGPEISDEEHEVTLHAERPVVAKETVPVERVRLAKEQVTGQETVSGEVRKEHIETETEGDTGTIR